MLLFGFVLRVLLSVLYHATAATRGDQWGCLQRYGFYRLIYHFISDQACHAQSSVGVQLAGCSRTSMLMQPVHTSRFTFQLI